ncbi:DNA primase large subunit Spp2 [Hyaloraphidium curvatum]|nr:DNA primase large subunit Spp2 [Hyaloraphidium curvatum]
MFKPKTSRVAPAAGSSHGGLAGSASQLPREYASRLSFYFDPPQDEITIHEFESWALDRLQVLKAIETAQLRSRKDDDTKAQLAQTVTRYLPLTTDRESKDALAQRKKDHVSHFILRLAFAKTEDLRAWFLRQESALFRIRWDNCYEQERAEFIASLNLDLEKITSEAKHSLEKELRQSDPRFLNLDKDGTDLFQSANFFKVPFERVLELVATRKVYIHKGYAYVPGEHQFALVLSEFRAHLSLQLEITAKALPRMQGDEDRLIPVLNNLGSQHLSGRNEYNAGSGALAGQVSANDVDRLTGHFPLCMKHLATSLKTEGHLKHNGRMQLGLFLKGIGLSLEEALIFWRRSFRTKTDEEFQKSYAYNIRHNYGKEGKRADYTPYGCMKIITTNHPGPGDHHGCPYRDFAPDNLKAQLLNMRIPEGSVNEVMNLVKGQHFQVACTRVFELTHPSMKAEGGGVAVDLAGEPITHPNQYFEMSYALSRPDGEGVSSSRWMKGRVKREDDGAVKREGDAPRVKSEPQSPGEDAVMADV